MVGSNGGKLGPGCTFKGFAGLQDFGYPYLLKLLHVCCGSNQPQIGEGIIGPRGTG